MDYSKEIERLLDESEYLLSDISPTDWAEAHRVMTTDVTNFAGKYKMSRTPYLKELLNTISPNHPGTKFAIMKGAQLGFSTGLLENAIGFIISQQPGNILFLTGHADLAEEAMSGKIDQMIDSCGLRPLIKPNVLRKKNQRTGDTNKSKEFPGGSLVAGSAGNHKLLRQRSTRYGFVDDFDAARHSTKESGSTWEMITQRFASYGDKKKIYAISTPEVKQTSNIEPLYLLGDQRKYYVPCPCCGDFITIEWTIEVDKVVYGITYEVDDNGFLIDGSVGYKCQSCGDIFDDSNKNEMLLRGEWRPTAKPSEPGFYSYHLSSLYAPIGMDDWAHYVRQYLKANPIDGPQDQKQMQTFTNLVLGETWEERGETPKANSLQRNIRDYEVGTLPQKLAESDLSGQIVMLTCASDLNGKVDDARLDYEIVAWTENGSSYAIEHGSIGTFIPNQTQAQKEKVDREKWTYRLGDHNNVWVEFTKILDKIFEADTGRRMKIMITGVDTGHYTQYAYSYIEQQKALGRYIYGLKGKDVDKFRRFEMDTPTFKPSRERKDLYLVEVNQIKDDLAESMKLRWKPNLDIVQPESFMNFPTPSKKQFTFSDYFSHFEAEHRIIDKNSDGNGISARWVKKSSNSQNHLWDCRVYNIALKDMLTSFICKEYKLNRPSWKDFCDIILKRR